MKLEISEKYAMDLAYFCKRATYYDAYERSHGETAEKRSAMANSILMAFDEISNSLKMAGYSPR